ncbi:unnamed protein product, partial [marine sediment metagenome]
MGEHINEFTGNWWIDETIHCKAQLAGLVLRDRPERLQWNILPNVRQSKI